MATALQYEWYWSSLLTGNALGGGQLEGLLLLSLETSWTAFGAESLSLSDDQLCLCRPGLSCASMTIICLTTDEVTAVLRFLLV